MNILSLFYYHAKYGCKLIASFTIIVIILYHLLSIIYYYSFIILCFYYSAILNNDNSISNGFVPCTN
jgi:hypothetical protein